MGFKLVKRYINFRKIKMLILFYFILFDREADCLSDFHTNPNKNKRFAPAGYCDWSVDTPEFSPYLAMPRILPSEKQTLNCIQSLLWLGGSRVRQYLWLTVIQPKVKQESFKLTDKAKRSY